MDGQWIGRFSGSSSGVFVADLDDHQTHVEGHAFLFQDDANIPNTVAFVRTESKAPQQTLTVRPAALGHDGIAIPPEVLVQRYPDADFPETAMVQLQLKGRELRVKWSTPIETTGEAICKASLSDRPSALKADPEITSWAQFRQFVVRLPAYKYVFRGQPSRWRLRTAFHRTHRKDLVRFTHKDMSELHRVLSARTRHYFQLGDSIQNGAFWHLAQHHGYPTPLLDWSASPFVAAYFAFRPDAYRPMNQEYVRIFMFDAEAWTNRCPQYLRTSGIRPHFSLLDAVTVGNERALPQQARSFLTNVDDIEGYLKGVEEAHNAEYLRAFDLPYNERLDVLNELTLMGVTPGSLFPGLDGACQELRARYFGYGG
ncbi:FRG domain-containing protein [Bosea sp. (in: a-proteobacteria)]|uniref:FRG domain-containing protein n=1 Tax=Bosea sp. (in: a-proteobacteria) TaxID=1871050 RepID=UPI002736BF5F|nr:FRG domain-containing protein [Bosea sp. (in: a-proteobacteria)]MDP3255384.1 FRG domain-containing protein [Bosea sp. (in: a-proteobacteria)]